MKRGGITYGNLDTVKSAEGLLRAGIKIVSVAGEDNAVTCHMRRG